MRQLILKIFMLVLCLSYVGTVTASSPTVAPTPQPTEEPPPPPSDDDGYGDDDEEDPPSDDDGGDYEE